MTATLSAKRIYRTLDGTPVSFYKRPGCGTYTVDFQVRNRRFQKSSGFGNMVDAERWARGQVLEFKRLVMGLGDGEMVGRTDRRRVAMVGELLAAMDAGPELWTGETVRTYRSALLRLARRVDALRPERVGLERVLAEENLRGFQAEVQGGREPNLVRVLAVNRGANTTIRNVKALFKPAAIKVKFAGLRLPELAGLRELPMLREESAGFEPWPVEAYEAMVRAAEALRAPDPELWLVNAMLRRLGLRDDELLWARREWLEEHGDGWVLVIKDRPGEWELLKHGKGRRLPLDEELAAVLVSRSGFLIADGEPPTVRHDLIYRTHSKFVRQFIPDRAKSNHELRMHAGSVVYTLHGLEAAANFLGHRSVTTTERYYAAWLHDLPMLDGAAVAQARVARPAA